MIAFPSMLVSAAKEAGMSVPEDPDNFMSSQFPHFHVFCILQLGRKMNNWTEHWENAKVIAAVSADEIKTMTVIDFIDRGLQITFN